MLGNGNYGIIFDMDGVIINTCKLHEESWFTLSKLYGFSWNDSINFKEDIFGASSIDSARRLFKNDIANHNLKTICREKDMIYKEFLEKRVLEIVIKGFPDFFSRIINSRFQAALATSSTYDEASYVLQHLDIYQHFKSIVSINNVKNPKPNPETYLKACKALGLLPGSCLGFEDSIPGITSLERAGVKCVVVGSTLSNEKLRANGLKFNYYIKDFSKITLSEVLDILEEKAAYEEQD
ncbi:MAG: HAD-IA family hydrolase [Clostridiaceae bacterium]|nr:HAD-IA family hydrolase [Clostridiaceae bacterium]